MLKCYVKIHVLDLIDLGITLTVAR